MTIKFTQFPNNSNWCEGFISDNGECFTFSAKLFDTGSSMGINEGRTSVLEVKDANDKMIAFFDRVWDVKPVGAKMEKICFEVVSFLEHAPKRFTPYNDFKNKMSNV